MAQRPHLSEDIERHAARLERDPGSRVFAQLADAYRKEGLLEEAIRICRDGLAVHPTYMSARVVLGRALLEQGALEAAEAEFGRVLEQVSDNLLALRLLGDIFAQRGQSAEARAYYERALRVNPLDRETQDRLAALPNRAMPGQTSPDETPADRKADAAEASAPGHLHAEIPLADTRQGGGSDPLASPTLAALYASQGFADVAQVMYTQLGDPPGERSRSPREAQSPRLSASRHACLEMLVSLREAARRAREARRTGQQLRGMDDH